MGASSPGLPHHTASTSPPPQGIHDHRRSPSGETRCATTISAHVDSCHPPQRPTSMPHAGPVCASPSAAHEGPPTTLARAQGDGPLDGHASTSHSNASALDPTALDPHSNAVGLNSHLNAMGFNSDSNPTVEHDTAAPWVGDGVEPVTRQSGVGSGAAMVASDGGSISMAIRPGAAGDAASFEAFRTPADAHGAVLAQDCGSAQDCGTYGGDAGHAGAGNADAGNEEDSSVALLTRLSMSLLTSLLRGQPQFDLSLLSVGVSNFSEISRTRAPHQAAAPSRSSLLTQGGCASLSLVPCNGAGAASVAGRRPQGLLDRWVRTQVRAHSLDGCPPATSAESQKQLHGVEAPPFLGSSSASAGSLSPYLGPCLGQPDSLGQPGGIGLRALSPAGSPAGGCVATGAGGSDAWGYTCGEGASRDQGGSHSCESVHVGMAASAGALSKRQLRALRELGRRAAGGGLGSTQGQPGGDGTHRWNDREGTRASRWQRGDAGLSWEGSRREGTAATVSRSSSQGDRSRCHEPGGFRMRGACDEGADARREPWMGGDGGPEHEGAFLDYMVDADSMRADDGDEWGGWAYGSDDEGGLWEDLAGLQGMEEQGGAGGGFDASGTDWRARLGSASVSMEGAQVGTGLAESEPGPEAAHELATGNSCQSLPKEAQLSGGRALNGGCGLLACGSTPLDAASAGRCDDSRWATASCQGAEGQEDDVLFHEDVMVTEVCSQCGARVPVWELQEHLDHHLAVSLHEQEQAQEQRGGGEKTLPDRRGSREELIAVSNSQRDGCFPSRKRVTPHVTAGSTKKSKQPATRSQQAASHGLTLDKFFVTMPKRQV
eukprot:jgi/Mesvir1/7846/Mv11780-RA.1